MGEVQYLRPDEPESPTHGQTQWIFTGGADVQDVPPSQVQNSTTTPTLRCLFQEETLEPLKKLGRTDWLAIMAHPEGHRFKLNESVLDTLADHPDFLQMIVGISRLESGSLIQLLAYSKLLAGGPKIVQPTAEQL